MFIFNAIESKTLNKKQQRRLTTFKMLGLAKSFLFKAMTRRLAESCGCRPGWAEDRGICL